MKVLIVAKIRICNFLKSLLTQVTIKNVEFCAKKCEKLVTNYQALTFTVVTLKQKMENLYITPVTY